MTAFQPVTNFAAYETGKITVGKNSLDWELDEPENVRGRILCPERLDKLDLWEFLKTNPGYKKRSPEVPWRRFPGMIIHKRER
jgi:hypothetical protein